MGGGKITSMSVTKHAKGFTIVELLIVIVIIAILAAITVVAFNGMQARAQLTRQTAQLDKIGKAIQMWSAENGKTLGESGAGANGVGVGGYAQKNVGNYTGVSIEDLLVESGYMSSSFDTTAFGKTSVLLSPCTTLSASRWVVMVTVTPAPQKSIADQISESGCTASYINLYTDPDGSYRRNLLKAY